MSSAIETTKKCSQINFGIARIQEILSEINETKRWTIHYENKLDRKAFDRWNADYHRLLDGEEYVLVYDEYNHLLYALNVTGNSVLCTLAMLMKLLMNKF